MAKGDNSTGYGVDCAMKSPMHISAALVYMFSSGESFSAHPRAHHHTRFSTESLVKIGNKRLSMLWDEAYGTHSTLPNPSHLLMADGTFNTELWQATYGRILANKRATAPTRGR